MRISAYLGRNSDYVVNFRTKFRPWLGRMRLYKRDLERVFEPVVDHAKAVNSYRTKLDRLSAESESSAGDLFSELKESLGVKPTVPSLPPVFDSKYLEDKFKDQYGFWYKRVDADCVHFFILP